VQRLVLPSCLSCVRCESLLSVRSAGSGSTWSELASATSRPLSPLHTLHHGRCCQRTASTARQVVVAPALAAPGQPRRAPRRRRHQGRRTLDRSVLALQASLLRGSKLTRATLLRSQSRAAKKPSRSAARPSTSAGASPRRQPHSATLSSPQSASADRWCSLIAAQIRAEVGPDLCRAGCGRGRAAVGGPGQDALLRPLVGLPLCVFFPCIFRTLLRPRLTRACRALAGYWPSLVIFVPNLVLISILLSTYHAKRAGGPPPDSQEGPTPLAKDPPDSSVDYLSNLVRLAPALCFLLLLIKLSLSHTSSSRSKTSRS